MDLRSEGPLVRDLVDVVLDASTEPLVTAVLRVGEDSLALEAPVDRGGRLVLPAPREGGLLVWRGAGDLMQAPVTVVETTRPPGPQWLVRLTGRTSTCQRRSFVRADVALPVHLSVARVEHAITALDISEGGLRCSTREALGLSHGTAVEVGLALDEELLLRLRAEVVRVRRTVPQAPLDLGLRFTDLSIKDADRLRRWIFAELRRQRANAAA
ncbi:MAG: PilZ domain-containing protein [Actinomycetota bacterium]|nr:PilZ domain-containing protein [Actinomycetota bacterium]